MPTPRLKQGTPHSSPWREARGLLRRFGEYTVRFDEGHQRFTCTCPAGNPPSDEHGMLKYAPRTCWHLRAVAAYEQSLREGQKERSQIDEYVRQGVDRETAMRVVYSHPTQYSKARVKRDQERLQARPFSILR